MQKNTEAPIELVWGTKNIGRVIGRTERQTFHLCSAGELPAKKVGGRWVANRDELESFFRIGGAA